MIETPIIEVTGLSKQYTLGSQTHFPFTGGRESSIWAVRDLSFQVSQGEIVGIIGRNGAGKSTLLKLLSRITQPTRGRAVIRGRVASLLEVGTGFHPELTGRENIFLNGTILGMKRHEIRAKFNQIVGFSEIGSFIDTPVKRYSSGMYVRLAFSVAAHIDPDVLIVDEVLSVGDIAFQKKCLGFMKTSAVSDRTVLFVTHNLGLVRTLCSRAILIEQGKIDLDGSVEAVVQRYLTLTTAPRDLSQVSLENRRSRNTTGHARFTSASLLNASGETSWFCQMGDKVTLKLGYKTLNPIQGLGIYIGFSSVLTGETVTTIKQQITYSKLEANQEWKCELVFPSISLRPGDYRLYICLGDPAVETVHDVIDENVNLPLLSVSSTEKDRHMTIGYFSMPSEVHEVSPS